MAWLCATVSKTATMAEMNCCGKCYADALRMYFPDFIEPYAMWSHWFMILFSAERCSDEVPELCADIIPYTSFPNKVLGLEDEDDYKRLLERIHCATSNCTDNEKLRWGVCHMVFPRCLMGHHLHLCRRTCRGKPAIRASVSFNVAEKRTRRTVR